MAYSYLYLSNYFFSLFFRSLFRLNFRRRTLFPFKWRQIFTVFFSRSQYLCIYMFRLHWTIEYAFNSIFFSSYISNGTTFFDEQFFTIFHIDWIIKNILLFISLFRPFIFVINFGFESNSQHKFTNRKELLSWVFAYHEFKHKYAQVRYECNSEDINLTCTRFTTTNRKKRSFHVFGSERKKTTHDAIMNSLVEVCLCVFVCVHRQKIVNEICF